MKMTADKVFLIARMKDYRKKQGQNDVLSLKNK